MNPFMDCLRCNANQRSKFYSGFAGQFQISTNSFTIEFFRLDPGFVSEEFRDFRMIPMMWTGIIILPVSECKNTYSQHCSDFFS